MSHQDKRFLVGQSYNEQQRAAEKVLHPLATVVQAGGITLQAFAEPAATIARTGIKAEEGFVAFNNCFQHDRLD